MGDWLVKAICKADEDQAHMPDYSFRLLHDVLEVVPRPLPRRWS